MTSVSFHLTYMPKFRVCQFGQLSDLDTQSHTTQDVKTFTSLADTGSDKYKRNNIPGSNTHVYEFDLSS